MRSERSVEIRLLDIQRPVFRPLINAHFFNQTQIEKLGVMRPVGRLVRIWMKMIAGKIRAFMTKSEPLLAGATEYIAWSIVAKECYRSFCISASFASCCFKGQMKSYGNICPEFQVFIGEVCRAIETIQTAW
jgi:hypothetical protein